MGVVGVMGAVGMVGDMGGVGGVGGVGIMGAVGTMRAVGGVGMVPRFVGGGSSQRDSEFLERGLKIEIKNFAKGVAGEAIKTFGTV